MGMFRRKAKQPHKFSHNGGRVETIVRNFCVVCGYHFLELFDLFWTQWRFETFKALIHRSISALYKRILRGKFVRFSQLLEIQGKFISLTGKEMRKPVCLEFILIYCWRSMAKYDMSKLMSNNRG
jgi:hypothetical protein